VEAGGVKRKGNGESSELKVEARKFFEVQKFENNFNWLRKYFRVEIISK